MSVSIQTNINSLIAQQNMRVNDNFQSQTIEQLTSGYRINSSGDDAAGLAVANKYRDDIAELTQGVLNANDGVSQLQIIDGGMNNISQMLDRLKTLATQSASDTFSGDRSVPNAEFQTLLGEIDRQAQSIGLNTGGEFNKTLGVYIGGGRDDTGAVNAANGTVSINLAGSQVDTQALGLKGMQVVAGTQDIGPGAAYTSVQAILADANNTSSGANQTNLVFSGPGFSDGSTVTVGVNTQGVTNIQTLVAAINDAITNAGNGTSQAATAFKNAGIVASVHTDASGGQELAFTSSTTAFQVQAGDKMANALLGNFATPASNADAAAIASTVSGGNTTDNAGIGGAKVTFSGAGMASPVTLTLNGADATIAAAVTDLTTQIAANSALNAAGFSVSGTAGGPLTFSSAQGLGFNVSVTGDAGDYLGFGAYTNGSTGTAQGGALGVTTATTGHLFFSFGGGASNTNSLAVTTGAGDTIATVVNEVNQALATSANANIQNAQLHAVNSGGKLAIVSGNGTAFNVTEDNGNGGSLGFGTVSADNNKSGASNVNFSAIDSGGASSLTTTATGTVDATQSLSFTGLLGGTTQGITFSANDANGNMQSKTITLTATNAGNIDQAVSQMNTVLQQTNNPTLQNIVAVKENVGGTEKINFISSAQAFQVAVGSTATGQGVNSGTATNVTGAVATGTGSTISIDTQAGAIAAVTAIENAVNKLGSAQSAVGRGENLLNYAQNLAQSQISNFSAAESRIRDADIAAEAANLTKAQVLQQASIAAMAQANSAPQAILKLLQ